MKISGKLRFILFNVIAAILLFILIGYIVLNKLDNYTRHGYSIAVPSFYGLNPEEARQMAENSHLRIQIIDSLYDDEVRPGCVVEQSPAQNARVKENRMINLIINAVSPEKIVFPNLKNSAYRQTLQTLKARGFQIGKIKYEPSEFKNLVLNLQYNGNEAEPGTLLPKGAIIDIILGYGTGKNTVFVPQFVGKTLKDAIPLAQQAYLNIAQIIPDESVRDNRTSAIIYRQVPPASHSVSVDSTLTLYITLQKQKIVALDSLMITE